MSAATAAASGTRSVLYAVMVLVRCTMVLTEGMATLVLVTSSVTATTATTSSIPYPGGLVNGKGGWLPMTQCEHRGCGR